LPRDIKEALGISPDSFFKWSSAFYSILDQLMKVSLTDVTLHVVRYARTLVIGVVLPHFNGTFAGVVLLAVWGTITCFVASRGLGLLVRVGELRAKTYLSPGSGAALGGGWDCLLWFLAHSCTARCFALPHRHGRWVKGTKMVYRPLTHAKCGEKASFPWHDHDESRNARDLHHATAQCIAYAHRRIIHLCAFWAVASMIVALALLALSKYTQNTPLQPSAWPFINTMHIVTNGMKHACIVIKTAWNNAPISSHNFAVFVTFTQNTYNNNAPLFMHFIESIFRLLEGVLHAFIELILPIANPCHHEGVFKLTPHFHNKLCIHLPTAVVGSTTKTHTLLKSLAPIHLVMSSTSQQNISNHTACHQTNLHSHTHPVGSDMSSPVACTLARARHDTFARTNIATPSTFGGAHPHMAGLVITHAIMCFIAFICTNNIQKIPAITHAEIRQFLHKRITQFCTHFQSLCQIVVSLHPVLSCCVVLHYHHAFVVLWLAGRPCISTCCIHALHHRMLCVVVVSLCVVLSRPAFIRRLVYCCDK
jgi:hypothetical protein